MKTKIRKILLTSLLFLGWLMNLQAQSKHEYAFLTASNDPSRAYFLKHIGGKEIISVEVDRKMVREVGIYNVMILALKEMEAEGWELFDLKVTTVGDLCGVDIYSEFFFLLRRKSDK